MNSKTRSVRVTFPYADEREMMKFVENNLDRVTGVHHNDDFDGHYWVVMILFEDKKKPTPDLGSILRP